MMRTKEIAVIALLVLSGCQETDGEKSAPVLPTLEKKQPQHSRSPTDDVLDSLGATKKETDTSVPNQKILDEMGLKPVDGR